MIQESFLEELKEKVNILDVASSYVNLSHKGRYWIGLCPFHAEKTASFCVYPESNSFYCFGCCEGGDIISFVEKIENLNYLESLKKLADLAGISLDFNSKEAIEQQKKISEKRRILEINRESAKFFYKFLWNGSDESKNALIYLKKRNFSKKTLLTFGVGYAPKNRFLLANFLLNKGYKEEEIVNANLAYNKYKNLSSRFFSRIIFPIIDTKGNVVAFGGRTLSKDILPKYLNTSDTAAFKKSMHLFSLNFAKKEKMDSLILVEGYMDAVSLYQNGFKNTVATLGTSLTENQAKIISCLVKEVFVCYDSDTAGEEATLRASKILRKEGLKVKIIKIPKGKDPDEFLRISGENANIKFKNILSKSKNDVEYKLIREYKKIDANTSEGKVKYLENAIKILSSVNNKIEREIYASKISRIFEINKYTVLSQIEKERKRLQKKLKKEQFKEISKVLKRGTLPTKEREVRNIKVIRAEEAVIAYIINNPESANNIFSRLPVEYFFSDFNKGIYKKIYEKAKNNEKFDFQSLCLNLTEEEINKVSGYLAYENFRDSSYEDIEKYIKFINLKNEEKRVLDSENVSNEEVVRYIKKLRQLKR